MDMFSREVEDYLWDRTYKDSHITMKPALDPEAAKGIAKKLVEAKNPVLHARRRNPPCPGFGRTGGSC